MKLQLKLFVVCALLATTAVRADLTNTETAAPEWLKNTLPNENHTVLKNFVGKWKNTAKFWMEPNAKAEEMTGTTNNTLIMGGRFLQTVHTGKATKTQPAFSGQGLLGYDVIRGEFQSTWIDNMNTALMFTTGKYNADTKTLTEEGTTSCPITGDKNKWFRAEWKVVDAKTYAYTMFSKSKEGTEYKSLEITYKKM